MPILAHGGERVIPVGGGGGGGGITIVVEGSVISEGDLIRKVRDGLRRDKRANIDVLDLTLS